MRRRLLIAGLGALLIVALIGRIVWVNVTTPALDVRSHGLGERVELEGSFAEYAYEST